MTHSNKWTNSIRVLLVALALVLATGFLTEAKACKDCPFPMRVADGKWMMPNGYLRIDIVERRLPKSQTEVHVQLVDARTGEVVAEGVSRQPKRRKTVNIQLIDATGKPVQGYIRFVDVDKEQIQAKFTCESCAISDMID
ncbi:MAG: hypothetical protein AAB250_14540 [Bdellovibrionota bacterium]